MTKFLSTTLKERLRNPHSQSAFTLVELIVVMMIIGVLAAMLLVNFQNARLRSRDAVRKADLRNIKSALQLYYNDYQVFPDDSGTGLGQNILGCGTGGTNSCTWSAPFTADGTQYMNALPADPINSGDQVYTYDQLTVDSYYLYVELENASDQDIIKSQLRCDPAVTSETDNDIVAGRYLVCND